MHLQTLGPHPSIPQASRRLARRLAKDLASRRLGYVQITVQAYRTMIKELGSPLCNTLARELILGPVVGRMVDCA